MFSAKPFLNNIYGFYRYDCCWPYALSFFFVLVIYCLDFFFTDSRRHPASLFGYGILAAYYLYNVPRYFKHGLNTRNDAFFIRYLSFKIILWGLLLALLYLGVRS